MLSITFLKVLEINIIFVDDRKEGKWQIMCTHIRFNFLVNWDYSRTNDKPQPKIKLFI